MLKELPRESKLTYQPNFSIIIFKNYINDYLTSFNSNTRTILINTWLNNKDFAFGLQIYYVLQNHLEGISNDTEIFDIRPYHVLWNHKKMILLLLKFLYKKGYLQNADYFYNEFTLIANKALILRNILLKYNITKNKTLIDKVILMLKGISLKEHTYYKNL